MRLCEEFVHSYLALRCFSWRRQSRELMTSARACSCVRGLFPTHSPTHKL
jgi:hypothetical protein